MNINSNELQSMAVAIKQFGEKLKSTGGKKADAGQTLVAVALDLEKEAKTKPFDNQSQFSVGPKKQSPQHENSPHANISATIKHNVHIISIL